MPLRPSFTAQELLTRIELGEDARTEFKEERAQPDDLASAIVSFANSEGGLILIGVSDHAQISGVRNPDEMILKIDNISRQNLEPPLSGHYVNVEKHLINNQIVLAVHVS